MHKFCDSEDSKSLSLCDNKSNKFLFMSNHNNAEGEKRRVKNGDKLIRIRSQREYGRGEIVE